jgi:hypothetical protein
VRFDVDVDPSQKDAGRNLRRPLPERAS